MDHTPTVAPAAFDPKAAAVYLGVSYDEVNRLIAAGKLDVRAAGEKGGKRLILRRDLDRHLDGLPPYEPRTREKSA